MTRPVLSEPHKEVLLCLVEAEPAYDRHDIRAHEMAGSPTLYVYQGRAKCGLQLHELEYLGRLGLIALRQMPPTLSRFGGGSSPGPWVFTPTPAGDAEAELLLAEAGRPTAGQLERDRIRRLDRRYVTFGNRMSFLIVGVPVAVVVLTAIVISEAANVNKTIPTPVLIGAGMIVVATAAIGASYLQIIKVVRAPFGSWLARVARRFVEGRLDTE